MEQREIGKGLKIPENASDKDDFIQGIGAKEVLIIIVSLVVVIALVIIIYLVNQSMPLAICSGIFFMAFTIMTVKRDAINENMIDKLKLLFRYMKMQKRYEYEQVDVLGGSKEEDGQYTKNVNE